MAGLHGYHRLRRNLGTDAAAPASNLASGIAGKRKAVALPHAHADFASRSGWPLLGLCAGTLLCLVAAFGSAWIPFLPQCLLHDLTGWHCPGCGDTRAFHHLAQGNVMAALRCNALCFALLPLAGRLALHDRPAGIRPFWIVVLAGAMVLFAVLRNIPLHPLTLLAPTT